MASQDPESRFEPYTSKFRTLFLQYLNPIPTTLADSGRKKSAL